MTYPEYIILVGFLGVVAVVIGMPLGAILGDRKHSVNRIEHENELLLEALRLESELKREQKVTRDRRRVRA